MTTGGEAVGAHGHTANARTVTQRAPRWGRTEVMATPVGPAARDPDDPDLWEEWYHDDDEDTVATSRFGWPVRLLALAVIVAVALIYVL